MYNNDRSKNDRRRYLTDPRDQNNVVLPSIGRIFEQSHGQQPRPPHQGALTLPPLMEGGGHRPPPSLPPPGPNSQHHPNYPSRTATQDYYLPTQMRTDPYGRPTPESRTAYPAAYPAGPQYGQPQQSSSSSRPPQHVYPSSQDQRYPPSSQDQRYPSHSGYPDHRPSSSSPGDPYASVSQHRAAPYHAAAVTRSSSSGPSRHECSVCGKRFSRPSGLKIHITTHTGEKPYVCPEDGCGRAFSVQSNMRRHIRIVHHGADDYESDGQAEE